jgi:hypothetical protein
MIVIGGIRSGTQSILRDTFKEPFDQHPCVSSDTIREDERVGVIGMTKDLLEG